MTNYEKRKQWKKKVFTKRRMVNFIFFDKGQWKMSHRRLHEIEKYQKFEYFF